MKLRYPSGLVVDAKLVEECEHNLPDENLQAVLVRQPCLVHRNGNPENHPGSGTIHIGPEGTDLLG